MPKAYVLINCDMGSEESVMSQLKEIDLVKEVHGTFGAYDIVLLVEAYTVEALRDVITWKIRKIEKVRSTLTMMVIKGQGQADYNLPKAYILLSCESGSDNYIISNLKTIETVREVYGTLGTFDVIAKLESDSEDKLKEIITKKIRMIPKIRATLTLMAYEKNILFGKGLSPDEKEALDRYSSQAYIAIHCNKTHENEVLLDLGEIPEVVEGDIVLGSFDIMCKVSAPTYNDISDVVTKKIRKIQNMKSTVTLNVIP